MRPPALQALAHRTSEITYPGVAKHIRAVRADLRLLLSGCPIADDVILCASELAANAALHSSSRRPGGTLTVRVAISPGHYVRIEVEDNGGPWAPIVAEPAGHHGFDIIRAVAANWGIEGDHHARTAWATITWQDRP